jgi:ribose 5-phosphate isomerase B
MLRIIDTNGFRIPTGNHEGKTIVIGSDHRGFEYKEKIKDYLEKEGYEILDVGTNSNERCDYPIFSDKIGSEIEKDYLNRIGIGICGSGIGILIPASKHKRVLAARCLGAKEAETSRKHNNSNLLGIGADYIDFETALEIVKTFLKTDFYSSLDDESYLYRYLQTLKFEDNLK